ncbi:pentapeptide repeat-containing protein [Streptomyces sp. HC307]|uniref:pentapeptide repeat-containing protein n=1 Tax=Streptomyces flavusporus TaxID=3385496 RepID=UPI003916FA99
MLLHVPQDVTATSADSTTQVWPYCAHGSGADGVGCRGRIVEPHPVCLAHLTDADRSSYLAGLQPGVDLDHRGTSFTEELLSELLAALTAPATDEPHLGNAVFDTARFSGDAHFDEAKISGNASFYETEIVGNAWFYGTEIGGDARFDDAEIGGNAWFVSAKISGDADFYRVHIGGDALFQKAQIAGETHVVATEIGGDLWLSAATIRGSASLAGAKFNGNVLFHSTVFERTAQVGPLVCRNAGCVGGGVPWCRDHRGVDSGPAVQADTVGFHSRAAAAPHGCGSERRGPGIPGEHRRPCPPLHRERPGDARTRSYGSSGAGRITAGSGRGSPGPYRCRPDRLPLRRDHPP